MIDVDAPVANLVLAHSATATVLDRLSIDYCCQGHRPLSEVIAERRLDRDVLLAELVKVMEEVDADADPRTASTSSLISRALARQHRHLRASLALLTHQARGLISDHGLRFPVVRVLGHGLDEIADNMLPHLNREEEELFPALLRNAMSPALRAQLGAMFDEHREFGQRFARLRTATRNYQAPPGSPKDLGGLFAAMTELEGMVSRHHHLENHVLLPRFR